MITILPFSRLTAPQVYEGWADVSLKQECSWLVEVRRTDGTIRRPFGDHWIPNTMLNQFKNQIFNFGGFFNYKTGNDILDLTYGGSNMLVGTDGTPAAATQTGIIAGSVTASSFSTTGNSATMGSTTGLLSQLVKKTFPVETADKTYREAVISPRYNSANPDAFGVAGLTNVGLALNRVAFPADISLLTGEQLILNAELRTHTIAHAPLTVTLAAQNGMNVSGQLKLVGTTAAILGGTVSAAGVITKNGNGHAAIFPSSHSSAGEWNLSGVSSFPAWNTATSGLAAYPATTSGWSAYAADSFYRDYIGVWYPGAAVTFQSISTTPQFSGVAGYQLLLTTPMTKDAAASLTFGLRFTFY